MNATTESKEEKGADRELKEVVRTQSGRVETANISVIIFALDNLHVSVPVGSHERVQLLPKRIHGAVL